MKPQPKTFKHNPTFARVFRVKGHRLCGGSWTTLRNAFLRAHPYCAVCGLVGEQVHHKTPRAVRPDLCYEWDNLQTVCEACHKAIHSEKPH